jgi:hypothetical protein
MLDWESVYDGKLLGLAEWLGILGNLITVLCWYFAESWVFYDVILLSPEACLYSTL